MPIKFVLKTSLLSRDFRMMDMVERTQLLLIVTTRRTLVPIKCVLKTSLLSIKGLPYD